jgi:hypothetical protein
MTDISSNESWPPSNRQAFPHVSPALWPQGGFHTTAQQNGLKAFYMIENSVPGMHLQYVNDFLHKIYMGNGIETTLTVPIQ